MNLFDILFIIFCFLTFIVLIGYRLILFLLSPKELKTNNITPSVTVLIPMYNEEDKIQNKIENLLQLDYPQNELKIIVINDGSTDNSVQIAKRYPIEIIDNKERIGKIKALNNGIDKSKSDIIVITDADVTLKKDSLKNLISYFSEEKIGGVTGNIQLKEDQSWYAYSEIKYQRNENITRDLEGRVDSVASMDGRLSAFRKKIVQKIDEDSTADDVELAFKIRKSGYKVVFAKNAIVYDEIPKTCKAWFAQKRGRSGRGMQATYKYFDFFLNPKYRFFGLLIFPIRRVFSTLINIFILYIVLYLLMRYIILELIITLTILFLFKKSRNYILYFILLNLALFFSWLDIIFGKIRKGAIWEKYQLIF